MAAETYGRGMGSLYSEHHSWLLGWLAKRLANRADAADLAQDTFTRILARRNPATIDEPRAYLTTVARGILVNWYQRQALEQAYLDALAVLPEAEWPSPEQRLIILQTLHQIDVLLDALPAAVKRAFLLSQVEGLRYEDIASELRVSVTTVTRYMAQAFSQCLRVMEDEAAQ